jgi:ribonuclease P protein component
MVGENAFPRRYRLTRADDYAAVFGFRAVMRGACFLLHQGPCRPAGESARLGLVIGKKCIRRAVGRNLVKRVIREEFRQARARLPARDLVFRLRVKLSHPRRRAVAAEVRRLLQTLQKSQSPTVLGKNCRPQDDAGEPS